MTLAVFNDGTRGRQAWVGYSWRDEQLVEVLVGDGPFGSRRVAVHDLARRMYRWPAGVGALQLDEWLDFFRTLRWQRDPFLIQDPRDPERELVTLEPAIGDASRTTFSLPTVETSEEFRFFPKQGSAKGYVNGAAVSLHATTPVDTDARAITFAAAPGVGQSVKASYVGLRLVRLGEGAVELASATKRFTTFELALEECLRS